MMNDPSFFANGAGAPHAGRSRFRPETLVNGRPRLSYNCQTIEPPFAQPVSSVQTMRIWPAGFVAIAGCFGLLREGTRIGSMLDLLGSRVDQKIWSLSSHAPIAPP